MKTTEQDFRNYLQLPICNTIKKILVGKLFTFHCNKHQFVIVAVRRNTLYGYLEILIGRVYPNKHIKDSYSESINIYSWYCYNPKHDMRFVGRSNKQAIRNCLKRNPKYINYHIGKSIDISKFRIYDNHNYYAKHKKTVEERNLFN